jgi:hypothetical protein
MADIVSASRAMNALECIRSINTPSVEEFFNFIEEKIRGK